jgi:hypothetical protein
MGLVSEIRELAGKFGKRDAKAPAPVTTEDRIAAVERALARLRDEREVVNAQIEGAPARRRELLLVDAADDGLLALDREIDSLHLQIERLDALEPELLDRLAEFHDAVRQGRWSSLVYRHDNAVREHLRRLAAAADSLREVRAILTEAQASFPVERGARMIGTIGLDYVADDALMHQERELDRLSSFDTKARPLPKLGAPRPPVTGLEIKAAQTLPHGLGRQGVARAGGAPPKAAPAPVPRQLAPIVPRVKRNDPPADEGERRIRVLRETSGPNCEPLGNGDELSLPAADADAIVRRGAADYIVAGV